LGNREKSLGKKEKKSVDKLQRKKKGEPNEGRREKAC